MSKARELIEALEAFKPTDEQHLDENKLVLAHDSHYGHERSIGYVSKDKHSGAHKALHTAYPNSINNPRELGSFPSYDEAASAVKKAHKEFENHPKYAKHYKK